MLLIHALLADSSDGTHSISEHNSANGNTNNSLMLNLDASVVQAAFPNTTHLSAVRLMSSVQDSGLVTDDSGPKTNINLHSLLAHNAEIASSIAESLVHEGTTTLHPSLGEYLVHSDVKESSLDAGMVCREDEGDDRLGNVGEVESASNGITPYQKRSVVLDKILSASMLTVYIGLKMALSKGVKSVIEIFWLNAITVILLLKLNDTYNSVIFTILFLGS